MVNKRGKSGNSDRFSLEGLQNHSHEIKTLASWKESYDQPRQNIKKQRHHFANKGLSSQSYSFSSKEQTSFNLMASVTICSAFGAQENKVCHSFHLFSMK